MTLSYVNIKFRPHDRHLNTVLNDFRYTINKIIDEVNDSTLTDVFVKVGVDGTGDYLSSDYFSRTIADHITIAHSYATTAPLAGGGDLSANRTLTLSVDSTDLGTDVSDQLYVKDAGIDHDATTNFTADEHYPYIDEDNMVSDSDAHVPTQQSVKAYVDSSVSSAYAFKTITGITNDVVADAVDDTLTLASANAILTIVGTTASDTITFTVDQAQIDHGSIGGLTDDDHSQYILHSLADAENDFLVASADDTFVKKTLAETGAILEADISHDNLVDFLATEHFLQTDITNVSTALSTGLLKVTTGTGALSTAVENTDYAGATHASRHQSGGADAIKLDDLATPDDNTDLNATNTHHGLLLKLDDDTTHFMRGDGTWAVPPGAGSATFVGLSDTPANFTGDAKKVLFVNAAANAVDFATQLFWDESNSRLGIGDSTPSAAFHTAFASVNPDVIIEELTAGGAAQLELKNTARSWWIQSDSSPDMFSVQERGSNVNIQEMTAAGQVRLGRLHTNNDANTNMTSGVTIYQYAGTNESLAIKQNSVAHGVTTVTETDTYHFIKPYSSTEGGVIATSLSESVNALDLVAIATSDDTNKQSDSANAPMRFIAKKKSGTGVAVLGADANAFVWMNNTTVLAHLDEDGDVWFKGDCEVDGVHTVGSGSGTAYLQFDGGAGSVRDMRWSTNGSDRWVARCDSTAEGGSNAGSDWVLRSYTDGGSGIGPCIFVERSTRKVVFQGTSPPSNEADLYLAGDGVLALKETSTPTADESVGKLYTKNDNKLYFQDGGGTEHEVAYA